MVCFTSSLKRKEQQRRPMWEYRQVQKQQQQQSWQPLDGLYSMNGALFTSSDMLTHTISNGQSIPIHQLCAVLQTWRTTSPPPLPPIPYMYYLYIYTPSIPTHILLLMWKKISSYHAVASLVSVLTPLEDEDDGNGFFTLYVKPMNLCSGKRRQFPSDPFQKKQQLRSTASTSAAASASIQEINLNSSSYLVSAYESYVQH